MMQLSLTTSNGAEQTLALPLRVEDVLKKPMPYFLAHGRASVLFDTPDIELNEELNNRMPASIEGGAQELNLLAYVLERMGEQRLSLLKENLTDVPCEISELMRRASYFCDRHLGLDGKPDPDTVPLEQYRFTWKRSSLEEHLRREFRASLEKQRMTGGQLFNKIIECARSNGDLVNFDAINEYFLPDSIEKGKLCSYEFDLLPAVNFGGSEGIYVDCYLKGKFDESGRTSIHIGTIKTLEVNLDACKTMGELCGALLYHETRYVNENLYLFDSVESIEHMISYKLESAQSQGGMDGIQFGQQM